MPTFCFICGLLGHAEKFCSKIFETLLEEIVKPYDQWMKALPRRQTYVTGSKWLRSGSPSQIPVRDIAGNWRNYSGEKEMGVQSGTPTKDLQFKEWVSGMEGVDFGNQDDWMRY